MGGYVTNITKLLFNSENRTLKHEIYVLEEHVGVFVTQICKGTPKQVSVTARTFSKSAKILISRISSELRQRKSARNGTEILSFVPLAKTYMQNAERLRNCVACHLKRVALNYKFPDQITLRSFYGVACHLCNAHTLFPMDS